MKNMTKFKTLETFIEGLLIIKPNIINDDRGLFFEFYNKKDFIELGIEVDFIQDNISQSKRGVLRGIHFQTNFAQAKLVRVIKGAVFDVCIDLRKDSPTYGKYFSIKLSSENKKIIFIPEGFGHAFLSLENDTEVEYKANNYYHPEFDSGIIWNDKTLNINWPFSEYGLKSSDIIISKRDKLLKTFNEYNKI